VLRWPATKLSTMASPVRVIDKPVATSSENEPLSNQGLAGCGLPRLEHTGGHSRHSCHGFDTRTPTLDE